MKIISVCNFKGGVGKSSISLAVAAGFAAKGLKVGIADLDEQKTCLTFFKNAENCGFEVFDGYPSKKPNLDILICDHSPERSIDNYPAGFSDLVIIPVLASAIDAWATVPFLEALDKRQDFKKLIIVNKYQKGRKLMTEFFENFDHDFVIYERAIYARTIANYSTIFKPRGLSIFSHGLGDAKKEINLLIKKIEGQL